MATILSIQRKLKSVGFDPGPLDGFIGPRTLRAMEDAILALESAKVLPQPSRVPVLVPASWMPQADMARIIVHWTAGSNKASKTDKEHYHILIEGDGNLVRGDPSIDLNDSPVKNGYAKHTLNCNGDSIGISLCGMAGAKEAPFNAGRFPITQKQWAVLPQVLADLCNEYSIPITKKNVLSHAEVQPTLGIKQRGKWDIARLPWDTSVTDPVKIGDMFRHDTIEKMRG